MEQTKLREQPFEHISSKEYGFFVRTTKEKYEAGNTIKENTFETWKQKKHNEKVCCTISVEEMALQRFIENCTLVGYQYVECILVPEDSKVTIKEINEKLKGNSIAELTPFEKLQAQMEQMQKENAELREELENKKVVTKKGK